MDVFSHALLPYLLGSLARMDKKLLAAFVLGGIAPDLDFLIIWINYIHPTALLLVHRGITHSFFFGLFAAITVLYLASRHSVTAASRRFIDLDIDFAMSALVLAYAGVLSHLILDYLTTRGVPLLYPWTETRFSANIFFHTEIIMMIVSLLMVAVLLRERGQGNSNAKLFMALIAIFLLVGAIRIEGKEMSEDALEGDTTRIYPNADLFGWSILDEDGDRFEVYEYNALTGTVRHDASYLRLQAPFGVDPEKALQAGEELAAVKLFRWRAYAVAVNASLQNDTWHLEYYDPVVRTQINSAWPILQMVPKSYTSVEVEVNGEKASVL